MPLPPLVPEEPTKPSTPRWWEIRRTSVKAKAEEPPRWNVSPALVISALGVIVATLALLIACGTKIWDLSTDLATEKSKVAALEQWKAEVKPQLADMSAYQGNIIKWQAGFDGEKKAAEDKKMDEMIKLLKGKRK
jgi:hypothetical protein